MRNRTKPIMTADDQRFMARSGLSQWLNTTWLQAQRIHKVYEARLGSAKNGVDERMGLDLLVHSECHFFAIAAWKVFEYRDWTVSINLFESDMFAEIDRFDRKVIKDVRDMREHCVDYFRGRGKARDRWLYKTQAYSSDASSLVGTMIGGRLDYLAFGTAAHRLHGAVTNVGRIEHRPEISLGRS